MSEKDNGGSAFPVVGHNIDEPWRGMSLRDWFAGMALTGILSDSSIMIESPDDWKFVAEKSYQIASSMLSQRKK